MTVKELIKKLLEVPVDIEEDTVTFQEGSLVVTDISDSEGFSCYLITIPSK